jgi:hypothetical protein
VKYLLTLVALISLLPASWAIAPDVETVDGHHKPGAVYQYHSFCKKDARFVQCERELLGFVLENGRTPATDIELVTIYNASEDELMGVGPDIPPETRFVKWPQKRRTQFVKNGPKILPVNYKSRRFSGLD